MEKKVESLNCERDTLKYEKIQALNNKMLAPVCVQTLLEEKNTLINVLETFRIDEDKS